MRRPFATVRRKTRRLDGFLKVDEYDIDVDKHEGGVLSVTRLVMERGDSVAVLGYDPERDAVVLVNEMRPGMVAAGEYPFADALVAGVVGPGEDPVAAAIREMREEAGLDLDEARLIVPGAYVSPGGTSERIAIVVGFVDVTGAGGVHGNPEESEDIRSVILSADVFIDRVRRCDIDDMKTMLAGYWLAEHRAVTRAAGPRADPSAPPAARARRRRRRRPER